MRLKSLNLIIRSVTILFLSTIFIVTSNFTMAADYPRPLLVMVENSPPVEKNTAENANQLQQMSASQASDIRSSNRLAKQIHKYLGYTTVALGVATALTAPDDDDDDDDDDDPNDRDFRTSQSSRFSLDGDGDGGLHHTLAYGTLFSAAATVSLGILTLSDDLYWFSGPWEAANYHAILGTVGAGLIAAAVSAAPGSSHADLGMYGGALMGIGIALVF